MDTARDVLQWVAAAAFLLLAAAALIGWAGKRERASSRLAWALGLFGAGTLAQAVVSVVYPAGPARLFPPHGWRILTPILIVLGTYGFLMFFAAFVRFPWWVHAVALAATLVFAVLSGIERPDVALVDFKIVRVQVDNPIAFMDFLKLLYVYFAAVFGVLSVAFGVYAVRVGGAARARMILITAGFFLMCASAGVVPRILFGRPSSTTIQAVIVINWLFIVASAPMLFFGLTPPRAVLQRFRRAEGMSEEAG